MIQRLLVKSKYIVFTNTYHCILKKTKFYSKKNKKNKYNFYTNRSVYDNPFNKLHWRQK